MSYIYPLVQDNITRYKVYFVHQSKKVYLGVYDSEEKAEKTLAEAKKIMENPCDILSYTCCHVNFKKYISLCNLRDHHVYIKNPIYLLGNCFNYYLSKDIVLTFDLKDLLFFSTYKICKRGSYIYIQDSITQQSILSRFGIQPYSVYGIDYKLRNGNIYDFRRENIEILNPYKGVVYKKVNNDWAYVAKIFINHDIIIGHYETQIEAAIAYNKAIDCLLEQGIKKDYVKNSIPYLTLTEYNQIYNAIALSPCIKTPAKQRRVVSNKKYRGICKDKSGFRASIGYKGKQLYLGIYPTEKRAAQAYNFASFYLYGNNGYVNDTAPLIDDNDSEKIAHQLAKYHIKK